MRVVLLLLFCSAVSFAGTFQFKNDTIPNKRYYIDKEDSIRANSYKPEKEARDQLNNTCAWTVKCRSARAYEKTEPKHVHRTGPRWLKPKEE